MSTRHLFRIGVLASCLALGGWGCSHKPDREMPPAIDPDGAAAEAMTEYDTNHDGVISGAELDKCPPLKSALKRFDTNGDGKVTAATIAARIRKWQESRMAHQSVPVSVRLDGQPLDGATVTFEPEKFLGPNLSAGQGTTDSSGNAAMQTTASPGLNLGLYKVRISKRVQGKEIIPARYNTDTELGAEVAFDLPRESRGAKFELTSK